MKAVSAELLRDVTGTYDKTKTTKFGNVITQTVAGKSVISPPLVQFIDSLSDFGLTPLHCHCTANGRLFITKAPPAGQVGTVVLYTFNFATGAFAKVGGINFNLPNTASHTIRQITVLDSGTTGWKILISTINTTATNGGLFMVNNVALADFVLAGFPTIPLATTGDTQASKKVFFLQETGTHLLTTAAGHAVSSDRKCYVGNGAVAAYSTYKFDVDAVISTVSAAGVTTDCFVHKTGTTGTAAGMLGIILLVNAFDIDTPTSGPNAGQECLYVPGSTGFNEFRLSDVTNGATSIPSLNTCNVTDAPNTTVANTPISANFMGTLNRLMFQAGGRLFIKPFVNSQFEQIIGFPSSQYRAAIPNLVYDAIGLTVTSTHSRSGWVFAVTTTAGQIGVMAVDVRSSQPYDYSYFITKILHTPRAQWKSLNVHNVLRGQANNLKTYYRGSNNPSDTLFDSPSGGWVAISSDDDMSAIASYDYVQLKGTFPIAANPSAIFAQPSELILITQPNDEIDDAWRGDARNSVSTSPARSAFSQVQAYTGSKHWEFRAHRRDTGALVVQSDTLNSPADFEISTDDGVSFGPVAGAIASSPLANVLAYKWATPPNTEVVCSLREKI